MSVESKIYLFWACLFLGIFLILEADVISANVSQAVNSSSWEIVAGGLV